MFLYLERYKKQPVDIMEEKQITIDQAHRYFGVECNNAIWPLIGKTEMSEEDKEKAVQLAYSALLHWSQFSGCKSFNIQRGQYMIARAYLFAENKIKSLEYALKCQKQTEEFSTEMKDFDHAYSHEILARSYALNNNKEKFNFHYLKAKELGEALANEGDKKVFMGDFNGGPWFEMA